MQLRLLLSSESRLRLEYVLDVILFAFTFAFTCSSAEHTFFSSSFLSHPSIHCMLRPCSPVSRRRFSSSSERSFPPQRTPKGAKAIPKGQMSGRCMHLTFVTDKRNDISLGGSFHDAVHGLVYDKGSLACSARIFIRASNNPSRRIRDALYRISCHHCLTKHQPGTIQVLV